LRIVKSVLRLGRLCPVSGAGGAVVFFALALSFVELGLFCGDLIIDRAEVGGFPFFYVGVSCALCRTPSSSAA
jgi:hypothetical protein